MTAARRRPRIALLVNFLDSAYQMSLRTAIGRVASRRGVDLLVAIGRALGHEDENERALNVLYDWLTQSSVDGAIVVAAAISKYAGSEGITRLCHSLAPVPTCSIGLHLPGIPSIIIDNRAAMRTQVHHLTQHHSRQRIAYIGGPSHNDEARERFAGYRDGLEQARITFDPSLTEIGQFSMPSGRQAMKLLLARTRDIDAVVAANDYMAIGAQDELAAQGIRVPEDVLAVGFDDAPVARYAPRSLSTVAQPIEEMAELAVDVILKSLEGVPVKAVNSLDVQLVLRESCGCGYLVSNSVQRLVVNGAGRAADYLRKNTATLQTEVLRDAGAARRYWASFLGEMIESLAEDLSGRRGVFLRSVEEIAERMADRETSLDEVARALFQLRRCCRNQGYQGADQIAFEETCMRGLTVLSSAATRREGRRALRVMDGAYGLREVSQGLALGLNQSGIGRNFCSVIPSLGINTAFLGVLVPGEVPRMQALLAFEGGRQVAVDTTAYPPEQLFPAGFPASDTSSCLLALPLTFEGQVLGLVAFGGDCDPFVCEAVRSQLSAALQLAALHARIVEETALRERLAREKMLGELAIARRIQTALIPKQLGVPGLELAAGMWPADQVGGDYYDVFNTDDGCWIGIGDVTGHGLLAGMIMLMMQSAVSALVDALPEGSPAQIVCRLNEVMRRNIRERLGEADHATFVMLRYRSGGQLTMAGAHEDVLVYRAAQQRCERLTPMGIWLGIAENIQAETPDQHFTLDPGDVLLLYTDGLIEARSASHEEFGLERVERILQLNARASVDRIREQILSAVLAWTPVQQDDVTLIVARRQPSA
jgi:DNA-binding LacI/PurR family transcriptional regulator/serine phosphatase RsbU (regulator of sigma subunit)